MKYYVLLKIPAGEKFFIEVGLDYELPFHPNITDRLEVAGFPCEIDEIYYNLDDLDYVMIRVIATDNLLAYPEEMSDEELHLYTQQEWLELKEWCGANNERVVLNDYYMNPERLFMKRDEE